MTSNHARRGTVSPLLCSPTTGGLCKPLHWRGNTGKWACPRGDPVLHLPWAHYIYVDHGTDGWQWGRYYHCEYVCVFVCLW